MTTFTRDVGIDIPIAMSISEPFTYGPVGHQLLPPVGFFNWQQHIRDLSPNVNSLTAYNVDSGALEYYAHNTWVPFVHASTTPAYGDSLAYNSLLGLWEPSPTTNPTIDSLRIYGSSTTALEVKRVYSDTGGSHSSSTGSMDAVGVHTLTGSSNVTYTITIDSSGTQDWFNATFTWTDATSTYTKVPVYSGSTDGRKVLAPIELSNGVFVLFTTGNYVNGETWTVTAIAADNQGAAYLLTDAGTSTTHPNDAVQARWALSTPASASNRTYMEANVADSISRLVFNDGTWLEADNATQGVLAYKIGADVTSVTFDASGSFHELKIAQGGLTLSEETTPSATANKGKFYAKDKSSETIPYWRNSTAEYEVGLLGTTAAPIGVDYLVGTASAGLTSEIVVGTSPGGELGGTWASPTVDTTHSGSSHAGVVSTHEAAADPHTGYVLESLLDAKGDLIAASAADTPAKLTVGANDTILMADSGETTGLKWVASATPVELGTNVDAGTADTFSRGDHQHSGRRLVQSPGGTVRVLAASSSPHVTLTGDTAVSAHLAVGAAATVGTAQVVLVQENPTQAADWKGVYTTGTITTASSAAARAYYGNDIIITDSGANAIGTLVGTRHFLAHDVAATMTNYTGQNTLMYVGGLFGSTTAAVATTMIGHDVQVRVNPNTTTASQTPVGTLYGQRIEVSHSATANAGQTATVTTLSGLLVDVNMGTSAQQRCTTMTGIDIDMTGVNAGTTTTAYALRIQDYGGSATITNRYGISAEGANPLNWIEGKTEIGTITAASRPTTIPAQLTVSSPSAAAVFTRRLAVTNDDVTVENLFYRVATTDGTVTTLGSFTPAVSKGIYVRATVLAFNTTGNTVASYIVAATFRSSGAGVVTQVGTTTVLHSNEDTAGWDATLDTDATLIRIRVTGAAATSITWHGALERMTLTS